VCPSGTVPLYKGFMTGSHSGAGGSASNFLCAHEDPKYVRGSAGFQGWAGALHGVELDLNSPQMKALFLTDNVNGGEVHNQDLPCVVCYVAASDDQIMITGRPDCGNSGYDLQYSGFLVSETNADRKRSEFVCVDEAPQGRLGGNGDMNQAVVFPVESACGSLPCSPYVDGMEVTCAVCTF